MRFRVKDYENAQEEDYDELPDSYNEDDPAIADMDVIDADTEDEDGLGTLLIYVQQAAFRGDHDCLMRLRGGVDDQLHERGGKDAGVSENEVAFTQELEGTIAGIVNTTITTLLYDALHKSTSSSVKDEISAFDSAPECSDGRATLARLNPAFGKYSEDEFREYITAREIKDSDYFGEYLSDDSDLDEDELPAQERGQPDRKKTFREYKHAPAADWVRQMMPDGMDTPFKKPPKVKRKSSQIEESPTMDLEDDDDDEPAPAEAKPQSKWPELVVRGIKDWAVKVTENAAIHYPRDKDDPWTKQATEDLTIVNNAISRGDLNVDTLTETRFCIAQYRGITYNTNVFSQVARRQNREMFELFMPVFSSYVFSEGGVRAGDFYAGGCPADDTERLIKIAEDLKQLLVAKRFTDPIKCGRQTYECHAYALQNEYTLHYHPFFDNIKAYLLDERQTKGDALTKEERDFLAGYEGADRQLWPAFAGFTRAKNFYVSTGNTPRHALRYAYGTKYYEGHGHVRLRPRWQRDGRAERPYSGKIYVSLHPISDYVGSGPMDVVVLNKSAKTHVYANIAYERECSFPAYIPADRIVAEHIARYPSFVGEYKDSYLQKYGLEATEYGRFAEMFEQNAPHTPENKQSKHALGEWMVRYHEVRLIEMARRLAAARGWILVFRDDQGFLARQPPKDVAPKKVARSSSKKSGKSANAIDQPKEKGASGYERQRLLQAAAARLRFDMIRDAERRSRLLHAWIRERFTVHATPMDGNCLFHALSGSLSERIHVVAAHDQLRTSAVAYLRIHRVRYGLSNEYLDAMAAPAVRIDKKKATGDIDLLQRNKWGGDREIEAVAHHIRIFPPAPPPSAMPLAADSPLPPAPVGREIAIRVYAPSHPNGYSTYNPGPDDAPHQIGAVLSHVGGNHWEFLVPRVAGALTHVFNP